MLLDLSKIRAAQEHFEKTFTPAQLAGVGAGAGDDEPFLVVAPVRLAFDIFKDGRHFRLAGQVQTRLELTCSRCLEPFQVEEDAPFDLRYQPHAEPTGEAEREVEEDDLSTAFYDNDEIDLGQLMREQFYLSLPMKPLCSDGCRGLCAICGTNLNRGTCQCTQEWQDPRLAALRELKKDS